MATIGSCSKEPETPRETLLVCRETVAQSNQRNSPCWWEPHNELKSVQNWTTPCSCVHVFLFLSCCVTISPTNALSFPLSSDCESTDVFLTIQSFSSSLKTLERFSRRKRALFFFKYFSQCAWVLLLTVYQFGVFTQTASPPNHNSPRGDRNLVFVVGLSPADVVPLASLNSPTSLSPVLFVMGEWNYIKHKTDHFDANLLMNLKESHWTKWPIVRHHIQMICCQ